jgi:hypothetical protein
LALLTFAPILFFAFGAWGTYHTLFADIDIGQNTSVAFERAQKLLAEAYTTGHTPSVFTQWGTTAVLVYILILGIYFIASCFGILKRCGDALDRTAARNDAREESYELARFNEEEEEEEEDDNDARKRQAAFRNRGSS